jgi:hypothetical protein
MQYLEGDEEDSHGRVRHECLDDGVALGGKHAAVELDAPKPAPQKLHRIIDHPLSYQSSQYSKTRSNSQV